jgi:hypothetical protein
MGRISAKDEADVGRRVACEEEREQDRQADRRERAEHRATVHDPLSYG